MQTHVTCPNDLCKFKKTMGETWKFWTTKTLEAQCSKCNKRFPVKENEY